MNKDVRLLLTTSRGNTQERQCTTYLFSDLFSRCFSSTNRIRFLLQVGQQPCSEKQRKIERRFVIRDSSELSQLYFLRRGDINIQCV